MTMYVVIRINKHAEKNFDFNIYTKSSSNKDKMIEYAKEIKTKYPSAKVAVMDREKAKETQRRFWIWLKEKELKKLDAYYKRSDERLIRYTINESINKKPYEI